MLFRRIWFYLDSFAVLIKPIKDFVFIPYGRFLSYFMSLGEVSIFNPSPNGGGRYRK